MYPLLILILFWTGVAASVIAIFLSSIWLWRNRKWSLALSTGIVEIVIGLVSWAVYRYSDFHFTLDGKSASTGAQVVAFLVLASGMTALDIAVKLLRKQSGMVGAQNSASL